MGIDVKFPCLEIEAGWVCNDFLKFEGLGSFEFVVLGEFYVAEVHYAVRAAFDFEEFVDVKIDIRGYGPVGQDAIGNGECERYFGITGQGHSAQAGKQLRQLGDGERKTELARHDLTRCRQFLREIRLAVCVVDNS